MVKMGDNEVRSAAILGHSFVRRLANSFRFERKHGEPLHITAANSLRISKCFPNVYIDGTSAAKIGDLVRLTNFLKDTKVDVVVFHSGSNDLCDEGSNPTELAKS